MQVKFVNKQRPSASQYVSMEVLQRYPGSLLLQLAEVAAGHANHSASILEVKIDCCDTEALAMAIHVHRTGSIFGGPLPKECATATTHTAAGKSLKSLKATHKLLCWLEQDVLGKYSLPQLHELDMAVGAATRGSLQLLMKAYQAAAAKHVAKCVIKLLPKGPPSSMLYKSRTAFVVIPEQAHSPFGLTVLRLEGQVVGDSIAGYTITAKHGLKL